jgi:hypothetical protein
VKVSSRPFARYEVGHAFAGKARTRLRVGLRAVGRVAIAVVFARCLGGLDAVARLDHVGLERDGTRTAV